MNDTNLLEETIEALADAGKTSKDVKWCGSNCIGWFSWNIFKKIADFEYDSGYGGAEIDRALVICGDDFWLERREYDGSEWWEFKSLPVRPKKCKNPTASKLKCEY